MYTRDKYLHIQVCMFLYMNMCVVCISIHVYVYVCLNKEGSDGQLTYSKSLEHYSKKDVDIGERIAPFFIERHTRR
jgi:hypothetical protein